MPVQVVIGSNDALLNSHETRLRVERFVPHARVTWVYDGGHILRPQTGTVAGFLERVRAVHLNYNPVHATSRGARRAVGERAVIPTGRTV